jgi:hypothetical protein
MLAVGALDTCTGLFLLLLLRRLLLLLLLGRR